MVICFCENDDNQFSCTSNFTCETTSYCYSAQQTIFKEENGRREIKRSAGCLYNSESSLFHVSQFDFNCHLTKANANILNLLNILVQDKNYRCEL